MFLRGFTGPVLCCGFACLDRLVAAMGLSFGFEVAWPLLSCC